MKDLCKEISFTDEQKASVEKIFTDFFDKMDEMHKSGSRPDRSRMEELEADRDTKIKKVLSEEDYKTYTKFMETHGRPPHGGPQDGPPPSKE